jgi:hypothetical protein
VVGSFSIFNLIGFFIQRRKLVAELRRNVDNLLCFLAGIFASVFGAFGNKITESLETLYFIHKLLLDGIVIRPLFS